jgi:hypothetical protein
MITSEYKAEIQKQYDEGIDKYIIIDKKIKSLEKRLAKHSKLLAQQGFKNKVMEMQLVFLSET